jgi:prophage tail gpP-like protein
MPKPQEIASITIGSDKFDRWESVEITRRFGEPFSHMRLRVAEIGDLHHGWKSLRLALGMAGTGTLAGQLAISGLITVRQVSYTPASHSVEVVVSSITTFLNAGVPPKQFENQTITQMANWATNTVGVTFKVLGNCPGADKPFERVSTHVGETIHQFVSRLAACRDLHLRDDALGTLIGTRAQGDAAVAQLQEGRNIKSAQVTMSILENVDTIEATGHHYGTDKRWGDDARDIAAKVLMSGFGVGFPRTLFLQGPMPDDKIGLGMFAHHEGALVKATVIDCTVTVPGWLRDDGALWMSLIGESVTIFSPMLFPEDRMTLSIRGVTHIQNSEAGTITNVECCLPEGLSAQGQIDKSDPGTGPETGPGSIDPSKPAAPDG